MTNNKCQEKIINHNNGNYKKNNKNNKKNIILRNKLFVEDYKRKHPCPCGETTPCCLSFHHKDGNLKEGNISDLVNKRCSIKRIMEEIEKCVVLCLNCHAKIHNNNGNGHL